MKLVHYEYRLKSFIGSDSLNIELVAKKIKHHSDVMDISASGQLIRIRKTLAATRTKNVASRYFFGTNVNGFRKPITASTAWNAPACDERHIMPPVITWRTSLRK